MLSWWEQTHCYILPVLLWIFCSASVNKVPVQSVETLGRESDEAPRLCSASLGVLHSWMKLHICAMAMITLSSARRVGALWKGDRWGGLSELQITWYYTLSPNPLHIFLFFFFNSLFMLFFCSSASSTTCSWWKAGGQHLTCGIRNPWFQEIGDFKGCGGECDVGVESESLISSGCK